MLVSIHNYYNTSICCIECFEQISYVLPCNRQYIFLLYACIIHQYVRTLNYFVYTYISIQTFIQITCETFTNHEPWHCIHVVSKSMELQNVQLFELLYIFFPSLSEVYFYHWNIHGLSLDEFFICYVCPRAIQLDFANTSLVSNNHICNKVSPLLLWSFPNLPPLPKKPADKAPCVTDHMEGERG